MQNGADGKSAIRVWIAAPSPAVRVGLRTLLESAPGLRVTTETARLPESGYFPDSPVDVVVLAASGGRITLPEDFPWPVLLLVQEAPPGRVLPSAVRAVLGLEASPEELAAAVQAVHAGLWAAAPGMLPVPWQAGSFESTLDDDFEGEKLSGRELEVLAVMGRGFTNRQIAAALVISENTVKFHVSSIYAKLGAGNRAEAIRLAARRGLLAL